MVKLPCEHGVREIAKHRKHNLMDETIIGFWDDNSTASALQVRVKITLNKKNYGNVSCRQL